MSVATQRLSVKEFMDSCRELLILSLGCVPHDGLICSRCGDVPEEGWCTMLAPQGQVDGDAFRMSGVAVRILCGICNDAIANDAVEVNKNAPVDEELI